MFRPRGGCAFFAQYLHASYAVAYELQIPRCGLYYKAKLMPLKCDASHPGKAPLAQLSHEGVVLFKHDFPCPFAS